jgi:uncharacterized membrane protein
VNTDTPAWVERVFTPSDLDVIATAVASAEGGTSGEIRVHFDQRSPGDALAQARQLFRSLGMERTRQRNGVLLYLALEDRKFAVFGDEGIHAQVGPGFWDSVRDVLQRELRAGRPRVAIVAAVDEIGRVLAQYFPSRPDDTNELSDTVSVA